jgi:hypothetical protein
MSYEECIHNLKLFWQYPVITEREFNTQNKHIKNYVAIPWATIIDSKYNLQIIHKLIKPYVNTADNFTCCQHISFRNLLGLFASFGIKKIYTPHKMIGEDNINGIEILPCPLYAVNVEDNTRNTLFKNMKNVDYINKERPYLYSFQGAYDPRWYLTDIRLRIFKMKHPENTYINNIGGWHFDRVVYNEKQNNKGELNCDVTHNKNKEEYNQLLLKSRFCLCPSGSGPNSIRFWEALAVGAIPIVLADTLDLPEHDWNGIIRVKEKDLDQLPFILKNISLFEENSMRERCLKIYNYFKNNYRNEKKNMVMFTNCHGEKYIDIFKKNSNITDIFNINYIVSYQQLNNFNKWKSAFEMADVLIINNIKNYNEFTIKSLKKILKKDVLLIVLPFIRFQGYWLPENHKRLTKFNANSVEQFPNIKINEIDNYLNLEINNSYFNHFNNHLKKLKEIENESDILFFNFFMENHLKYPMFRDSYHPTKNILEYIGIELIKKINEKYNLKMITTMNLSKETKEYGHYKPINNNVKKILNIQYDLDKIFICNRKKYLKNILEYENSGKRSILDLNDMKKLY